MAKTTLFYGIVIPIQEFILRQVEKEHGNRLKESVTKYVNKIYTKYTGYSFIAGFHEREIKDDIFQTFLDMGIGNNYLKEFMLSLDKKEKYVIFGYLVQIFRADKIKIEEDAIKYFRRGELEDIERYNLYNISFELYKIDGNDPITSVVDIWKNRRKL